MDEKKTTSQYSLIAGILFGIFALKDLSFCIQFFNYRDIGWLIIGVLFLIASAALAVLFITKKSGIFMTAVLGCLTLLQLWQFIDYCITTLIISKKPGNTGISRDIRTEFTTDLLLSD